jgi:hypothetical protein
VVVVFSPEEKSFVFVFLSRPGLDDFVAEGAYVDYTRAVALKV